MEDEEKLVRRARQGDHQAFTRLYEAHFDQIYRYVAFRIGNKTEAEDMTQQVFLNALQSIASFQWQGKPFVAWLFRIAHNQAVDHLRKKTKQVTAPLDESLIGSDSNPQLMAEHNRDIEQLRLATGRLTKAQQAVVSLRFVSGLSIAEVAKIMGKSQGAVKALQHSALVALRQALLVANDEEV